uniref:Putative reeler n=2 Tax=Ixodes ricinus TaxID=34613 RepID=V5GJ38_IXORI
MASPTVTLSALLLLLLLLGVCKGHPDGADEESCKDMIPEHGCEGKSAEEGYAEGYRLVQAKDHYNASDVFPVLLLSVGSPFKGFLIKAFDENEEDLGSFRSSGPDAKKMTHCAGITHTDNDDKRHVLVNWVAPADRAGKVHFKVTVVKDFSNFYLGLTGTLPRLNLIDWEKEDEYSHPLENYIYTK